jgi:hypothetical protein
MKKIEKSETTMPATKALVGLIVVWKRLAPMAKAVVVIAMPNAVATTFCVEDAEGPSMNSYQSWVLDVAVFQATVAATKVDPNVIVLARDVFTRCCLTSALSGPRCALA